MPDIKEKLVELIHHCTSCEECFDTDIVDHLIANGVTIQKWISAEERLPEKEGFYLTHRKDDGWQHIEVTWYGSGCLWSYIWTHEVTHWMPLPAPPEGDADNGP